jgi:hypothetical protein
MNVHSFLASGTARAGHRVGRVAAALLALAAGRQLTAQDVQPQAKEPKAPKAYEMPPLFVEAKPLSLTLTTSFKQIRRDRAEETPYRPATLTVDGEGGALTIPLRVRTRGIWRKKNCDIPPLMLNFIKDSTKKTLFAKLDRTRLSLHCRDHADYEQYVLQEYNLYRVQALLTPYTYNVRLARVTYIDSEKKDTVTQRWAFLQEQDDEFADRMGAKLVTTQGAGPGDLEPYESAFLGIWQYFVGNSDFSIRALHNVVLLYKDQNHVPVARDFDWSGAVNARYAKPNEVLPIKHVTERIMRGYCAPQPEYEKVIALFKEKKDAIYALYRDDVGALLKPNVVKQTLAYFDEFYKTINDPREAQRKIIGACLGGSA